LLVKIFYNVDDWQALEAGFSMHGLLLGLVTGPPV